MLETARCAVHPLLPLLVAIALMAGCGSSDPPDGVGGGGDGGGNVALPDAQVASGGYIVVPAGTRVQLGDEAVGSGAWQQQFGPAAAFEAGNVVRTPDVAVPTELRFRDDGDQTGILVQPPASAACAEGARCVGSSRRRVTPTPEHIAGMDEERLLLLPKSQRFNLGGFGIDPTQNFPSPIDQLSDALTLPADDAFHRSRNDGDEHTWLRTLVLSEGDTVVVFMALDAVGIGNIVVDRLTGMVSAATGIAEENIILGSTHTHAGADLQGLWGGVPQDWIDNVLYPEAAASVVDAMQSLRTVSLQLRQGNASQFNRYRRPQVVAEAEADPTMSLLEARDVQSGQPVARLMQFNAHPTSINEDPRIPHGDYVLGAVDWLERQGGIGVYFNGPIADASARGGEAGEDADAYERVRARGMAMAQHALQLPETTTLDAGLVLRQETATLPVTNPLFLVAAAAGAFNRYYNFTGLPLQDIPFVSEVFNALPQVALVATTRVSRIIIGDGDAALEIVTIPGEATNTFGQQIREFSGEVPVLLLGLTHQSLGYIIPGDEFSFIDGSGGTGLFLPFTNYEEFVSLGPLTAPLLRLQAYAPLYDAGLPDGAAMPPALAACFDELLGEDCIVNRLAMQLDFLQAGLEAQCREAGGPDAFCGLLNPQTPLAPLCLSLGLPPAVCSLLGEVQPEEG